MDACVYMHMCFSVKAVVSSIVATITQLFFNAEVAALQSREGPRTTVGERGGRGWEGFLTKDRCYSSEREKVQLLLLLFPPTSSIAEVTLKESWKFV